MGRFFVFHGQGVPRFAVARIGSEVMEKGGGLYSFEWVDAVASVFQLISLVGKLSEFSCGMSSVWVRMSSSVWVQRLGGGDIYSTIRRLFFRLQLQLCYRIFLS